MAKTDRLLGTATGIVNACASILIGADGDRGTVTAAGDLVDLLPEAYTLSLGTINTLPGQKAGPQVIN